MAKGLAKKEEHSELTISNDALSFFDEVGGGAENLEHLKNPFIQISTQGSRYKVAGELINEDGVKFAGHVMRIANVRAYYKEPYDAAKPTPPDCGSIGGVVPDAMSKAKQASTCAVCPHSKWGTSVDAKGNPSRGKACKEVQRLVLHVQGIEFPCLLNFPPTSQKSLEQFLKLCSTLPGTQKGVPAWAVEAEFGFEAASYPQPRVVFSRLETDVENLINLREMRNSATYIKAEKAFATVEDYEAAGAPEPADDRPY